MSEINEERDESLGLFEKDVISEGDIDKVIETDNNIADGPDNGIIKETDIVPSETDKQHEEDSEGYVGGNSTIPGTDVLHIEPEVPFGDGEGGVTIDEQVVSTGDIVGDAMGSINIDGNDLVQGGIAVIEGISEEYPEIGEAIKVIEAIKEGLEEVSEIEDGIQASEYTIGNDEVMKGEGESFVNEETLDKLENPDGIVVVPELPNQTDAMNESMGKEASEGNPLDFDNVEYINGDIDGKVDTTCPTDVVGVESDNDVDIEDDKELEEGDDKYEEDVISNDDEIDSDKEEDSIDEVIEVKSDLDSEDRVETNGEIIIDGNSSYDEIGKAVDAEIEISDSTIVTNGSEYLTGTGDKDEIDEALSNLDTALIEQPDTFLQDVESSDIFITPETTEKDDNPTEFTYNENAEVIKVTEGELLGDMLADAPTLDLEENRAGEGNNITGISPDDGDVQNADKLDVEYKERDEYPPINDSIEKDLEPTEENEDDITKELGMESSISGIGRVYDKYSKRF